MRLPFLVSQQSLYAQVFSCELSDFFKILDITFASIYLRSFSNVRFRTRKEFLNIAKCRRKSRDTVYSTTGS